MNNRNLEIKINSKDGKEIVGGFSLSVGNPHVIFFIEDLNQFDLKKFYKFHFFLKFLGLLLYY